ncbi:MAG: WbqC family protein [Pseudoxanthomonas sp.]
MNRVVIIQSNYIPWKGYFDLLSRADTIVLLDSVQSTKNDWRNRNQIKTNSGKSWLTIPVRHSNQLRIREVEVASRDWNQKHVRSLAQSYSRAPHATQWLPIISGWYEEAGALQFLSEVNRIFIRHISNALGIRGRVIDVEALLSDQEHDALEPTARLVEICRKVGGTSYLSGPSARSYLDETLFSDQSIGVEWFDYDAYPTYPQLHGEFDHAVSILDLLLMVGPEARKYAIRA